MKIVINPPQKTATINAEKCSFPLLVDLAFFNNPAHAFGKETTMHDVKLMEFRFALPIIVSINDRLKNKVVSSAEFPHEFFGLSAVDQVAVINGILCTLFKQFGGQNLLAFATPCTDETHYPMHLGIGITVRRTPVLRIETQFSYPASWDQLPRSQKAHVANSIGFLLQTAAVSIVNRECTLESA